jgi:hypothetical protein
MAKKLSKTSNGSKSTGNPPDSSQFFVPMNSISFNNNFNLEESLETENSSLPAATSNLIFLDSQPELITNDDSFNSVHTTSNQIIMDTQLSSPKTIFRLKTNVNDVSSSTVTVIDTSPVKLKKNFYGGTQLDPFKTGIIKGFLDSLDKKTIEKIRENIEQENEIADLQTKYNNMLDNASNNNTMLCCTLIIKLSEYCLKIKFPLHIHDKKQEYYKNLSSGVQSFIQDEIYIKSRTNINVENELPKTRKPGYKWSSSLRDIILNGVCYIKIILLLFLIYFYRPSS